MSGKKRDAPVSYRPPESLRAAFHARVSASGLSTSAFITRAVFDQAAPRGQRRASIDQKSVATLLAQAALISDQLRTFQIETDPDGQTTLAECHAELREIRTCLMHALGRDP